MKYLSGLPQQTIAAIIICAILSASAFAAEPAVPSQTQANAPSSDSKGSNPKPPTLEKDPLEEKDISDLEESYWRPSKDELDVVQGRRFEKAKRFELGLHYGIYQGQDFVDSKSTGASLTYNLSNSWFLEASHMQISNNDNEFLKSVKQRFGFTPDFNRETSQSILGIGFVPIYAKFSLLGKKISHFEMYVAPGVGITETVRTNLSGHLTIGQKFYVTEHFLLRLDWRMTRYTDRVTTTQGSTSKANGGPGFIEESKRNHNILFGLGWMF